MSGQWYIYLGTQAKAVPDNMGDSTLVRPRSKFQVKGTNQVLDQLLRDKLARVCSAPKVAAPARDVSPPKASVEPAPFVAATVETVPEESPDSSGEPAEPSDKADAALGALRSARRAQKNA